MGLIVGRLIQIQWLDYEFYRSKAEQMQTSKIPIHIRRGTIRDRNEKTLAISVKSCSVYFVPEKLEDEEETTALLSWTLGVDREQLLRKARQGNAAFEWVKRQATLEERKALEKFRLRGVGFRDNYKRMYPMGELAAQLIGFVGVDNQGLEGLEKAYESVLGYAPSMQIMDRDGTGRTMSSSRRNLFAIPDVMDLELTLDVRAQHVLQKELGIAVDENEARCGVGIVIKPSTGEILAMANYPSYDPNEFKISPSETWRNRAITDLIAPGSTFKVFPAAIAMDAGLVDENTLFDCENGRYRYHSHWIKDVGRNDWLTFEDVIKKSSNIGMVKMSTCIPRDLLLDGLTSFGFGSATGLLLPGEGKGILHPISHWSRISPGQIAIGQEISCTAIQLAFAYCAIANHGILMRPRILASLKDKKGRPLKTWDQEELGRPISSETAHRITQMLVRVVSEGTGSLAAIPGIRVAGKTGTAQKVDPVTKRYSHEDYTCLFCGFFPAEKPELLIVLVIDEPRKDSMAGRIVAPLFSRIGQQLAVLYGIEPDREVEAIPAMEGAETRSLLVSVPSEQINATRVNVMQVNHCVYHEEGTMPNVLGLTMAEVLERLGSLSLGEVRFSGSGMAVAQCPNPGAPLMGNPPCAVVFTRR